MEAAEENTSKGAAPKKLRIIFRGGIHINSDFENLLAENGLGKFEDFHKLEPEEVVKHVRDERMTCRVVLKAGGEPKDFYLKKTVYSPAVEIFRTVAKWTKQFNNAVREFDAYRLFLEAGIPTAIPVAAGKRGCCLRVETFCMTEALPQSEKLEDYVPKRFAPPLDGEKVREKHELARKVGVLARKMHNAKFNHRDLYLCHVRRLAADGSLAILDLNRAGRFPMGLPERWIVKDVAALAAGPMPDGIVHDTDRLRCFKAYMDQAGKLPADERDLLFKVAARVKSLRARGEKSRKRDADYMAKETALGK
ncbi:MAG: lipopolysaccharide kinase InaA family protein [Planctomycetota bacterium]|jgi:hypothetical protein